MERFGKYVLFEKIGHGGMAEIYRAKLVGEGGFTKLVALKRILENFSDEDEFIKMLADEARIAVTMTHENVVQVFDYGRVKNQHFIAMEFIRGKDLGKILRRCVVNKVPLSLEHALYVAIGAAKGLAYAHARTDDLGNPLHIVHRDISPQNIIVSYTGEAKIVDFGIARAANKILKTQADVLKGKVGYMSPEQAAGQELDNRSDIFSLGILIYEMLTLRRLFHADSNVVTLRLIQEAQVPPLRRVAPELPPDLEGVVMKALSRDREERYSDARALQVELTRILHTLEPAYTNNRLSHFVRELFDVEVKAEDERLRADELAESEWRKGAEHDQNTVWTAETAAGPATVAGEATSMTGATTMSAPKRWVTPAIAAAALVVAGVSIAIGLSKSDRPAAPPTAPIATNDGVRREPARVGGAETVRARDGARGLAREGQPPSNPPVRGEVDAGAASGALVVTTNRRGAVVSVDGIVRGRGTSVTVAGLSPGYPHVVEVRLAGHRTVSKSVTLEAGKTDRLPFSLEVLQFSVNVTSSPPGAGVIVDGFKFVAPSSFSVVGGKSYRFKFELPEHEGKVVTLDVKDSAPGGVHADLTPFRYGTLSMGALCAEKAVIDGKTYALPIRAKRFRVGTYKAVLKCDELETEKTVEFSISTGVETKKHVEFKR